MKRFITELGYLGFEVSDMLRWERFSSEVLGLACLPGPTADVRLLRLDERRYRFILSEGPADDCVYAGWQTADTAAVEAFGVHLDALGITWSWASDEDLLLRGIERMLHFKDPAGNRHEIYCGPALASTPLPPSVVASGFVTREEGLGHVVYSSSAYADTLQFAQAVLGFTLSDQIEVEMAPGIKFEVSFLHANKRHHSFALAPRPPTRGPAKQIHHFMIEVNSIRDVGFARDRCLAMGQAVHMDIGQHPNDRMISFYGETPSGFYVEYGYGGVKVDMENWEVGHYDRLSEWGHRPHVVAPMGVPAAQRNSVDISRGPAAAKST